MIGKRIRLAKRFSMGIVVVVLVTAVTVACQGDGTTAVATSTLPVTSAAAATSAPIASPISPTVESPPAASSPPVATESTSAAFPTEASPAPLPLDNPSPQATSPGLLFLDTFVDNSSGWIRQQTFDNFYIGYHEPEWYHVEVQSPHDNALVPLPNQVYENVSVESKVFVEEPLTSESGDFRYGLVLRRAGKQFYAFTISPRSGTWFILKSTPNNIEVLKTGTDETLGTVGGDLLRVDAAGTSFSFIINGRSVATINDADYSSGEIGFYVENFDSPRTHIHFDTLTVSELWRDALISYDDFDDSSSGWVNQQVFDNHYIGYHEPEWYHVEVQSSNNSAIVTLPDEDFEDITVESDLFVEELLTSESGDFRYGLIVRRVGNQYYAFTISPRSNTWAVLKNSPSSLEILQTGSDESIGSAGSDTLRVDATGSIMTFNINGRHITTVEDTDYHNGEIGFYVENFDSPRTHIHYDTLRVLQPGTSPLRCLVTIGSLNLRSGPGELYTSLAALPFDTNLQPLSRSSALPWIEVRVPDTGQTGWVYAAEPFASCTFPLENLPFS